MATEFWLSERHWKRPFTFLRRNSCGLRLVNDGRVTSSILQVLKSDGAGRGVGDLRAS